MKDRNLNYRKILKEIIYIKRKYCYNCINFKDNKCKLKKNIRKCLITNRKNKNEDISM